MNERSDRLGEVVKKLPADRLLAGVGIALLMASERLFNECDTSQPRDLLEASEELYTLSSVLAAFCNQHEHRLQALDVELPDEIGALQVKNPLYISKDEKAHPF